MSEELIIYSAKELQKRWEVSETDIRWYASLGYLKIHYISSGGSVIIQPHLVEDFAANNKDIDQWRFSQKDVDRLDEFFFEDLGNGLVKKQRIKNKIKAKPNQLVEAMIQGAAKLLYEWNPRLTSTAIYESYEFQEIILKNNKSWTEKIIKEWISSAGPRDWGSPTKQEKKYFYWDNKKKRILPTFEDCESVHPLNKKSNKLQ